MQAEDPIQKALRLVENAEAALQAARVILKEQEEGQYTQVLKQPDKKTAISYDQGETQIIEGHFDGANYASKSKLVEGDRLKLTIMPNGSFIYKQIAPVERDHIKGTLTKEDGQFRVAANGKNYKVLLASVTYYKGDVGDEVTLITPQGIESTWGTIEAIIPHVNNRSAHDDDGELF